MNQIASSILILAASICGYTAAIRPANDGYGSMLSLIALGLGLWGCLALLTAASRDIDVDLPDGDFESRPRLTSLATAHLRGVAHRYGPSPRSSLSTGDYRLSPETHAQVALTAERLGQTPQAMVEEIVRRNMTNYANHRVA